MHKPHSGQRDLQYDVHRNHRRTSATITSWSRYVDHGNRAWQCPGCAIQQQVQYGGSTAQCGELVITAGNGKQSIDAVTVTVGGKMPTHVSASQTIQSAIDKPHPAT